MKKINLLSLIFILLIAISFPNELLSQEDTSNPQSWKYFRILVFVNEDSVFSNVLQELGLGNEGLSSFTLYVNISGTKEQDHYVVIGDEKKKSTPRYSWYELSEKVQKGLLHWTGKNKENLANKNK
jgi:hypothetical protein